MSTISIPSRRGLLLLGLGLLMVGAMARPVDAGGLFHKKGQLVAVPTQATAVPVQVLTAIPVQAAQVSVVQLQQAQPIAAAPMQWSVVQAASQTQLQAQAAPAPAPAPSPTIHITVVEAATPEAQAAPQATAQTQQVGAAPAQVVSGAAPVVSQATTIPQQGVPVQLFYIPPTHKCSIFCKH